MGYKRKILAAKRISRRRKDHISKDVDYVAAKRQCLKKVAYVSEKNILLKINEIAEEGRRGLRYYQCPFCSLWHMSSHKKDGQTFVS